MERFTWRHFNDLYYGCSLPHFRRGSNLTYFIWISIVSPVSLFWCLCCFKYLRVYVGRDKHFENINEKLGFHRMFCTFYRDLSRLCVNPTSYNIAAKNLSCDCGGVYSVNIKLVSRDNVLSHIKRKGGHAKKTKTQGHILDNFKNNRD